MPRKPPRPSHVYLTETEIQQLGALVHRGARHLPPAECNRLLLLFQHHLGDLQQARRTATGLREQVDRLRQRVEQFQIGAIEREALLADARDLLEPWGGHGDDWPAIGPAITVLIEQLAEARMWARHGYELGQRSFSWGDHGVAPAWLTDGHEPQAAPLPEDGGNAEGCPQCRERRDMPYPFLCPGHPAQAEP